MTKMRVQLRNGQLAVVRLLDGKDPAVGPVRDFVWMASGDQREFAPAGALGAVEAEVGRRHPVADLWRSDGTWAYDGREHSLDIVKGLA